MKSKKKTRKKPAKHTGPFKGKLIGQILKETFGLTEDAIQAALTAQRGESLIAPSFEDAAMPLVKWMQSQRLDDIVIVSCCGAELMTQKIFAVHGNGELSRVQLLP